MKMNKFFLLACALSGTKRVFFPAETKTYVFDAESEKDLKEWRESMQNVQLKLFAGDAEASVYKGLIKQSTWRLFVLLGEQFSPPAEYVR